MDDAVVDLARYWTRREPRAFVRWVVEVYPGLAYSSVADNLVYRAARVLHEDADDPAAAIALYEVIRLRFHRSGFWDDAIWQTAVAYRELATRDPGFRDDLGQSYRDHEYHTLLRFIDGREVSWVMGDYDSVHYSPTLFRLAEMHEEAGELELAIAMRAAFQQTYPLSLRVDDAFHIMELQAERGDVSGMRRSLRWLEREYPLSRFARARRGPDRRAPGAMIEVRGVVKYYQSDRVLDDVSLRVEDGQQLALIGPGGAGKTLLLKIITALVEPDAGEVRVGDTDMNAIGEVELARVRNGMGMLFQNYALFDFMNVEENIAFPLRQRGEHTDAEIREKVDELLAKVDLPGINQKFPNELSGGMKKRVTFARAVIHDPPILFYDDPTAGLDPRHQRQDLQAAPAAPRRKRARRPSSSPTTSSACVRSATTSRS